MKLYAYEFTNRETGNTHILHLCEFHSTLPELNRIRRGDDVQHVDTVKLTGEYCIGCDICHSEQIIYDEFLSPNKEE